ncbi:MAG: hypothetical protein WA770_08565, partial [Pseudolabrys sp.]
EDGGGNACIMDEKELALCEAAHIRLAGTLLFCLCRNEATENLVFLLIGTIIGLSSFGNRAYRHEIHD